MGLYVLMAISTLAALYAGASEWMGTYVMTERYHSHHDSFTTSTALTRSLAIAQVTLAVLASVLGYITRMGAFGARFELVATFFSPQVLLLFCLWLGLKRYKVSTFETQLVVRPPFGVTRVVAYKDIEKMAWSGVRMGSGLRSLCIWRKGTPHPVVLWAFVSLDQVLMRIDRFDVLEHEN